MASSFLASAEFKERFGEDVSNESYVNTLYINVLGWDYDQTGYDYWFSNLNNGVETKYELLLGFSESLENKGLFSEMTGFYEIYDLLNLKLHSLLELKISSHSLL